MAQVQASAAARVSLVLLAVIASVAALYWLADILTPLALAVFLAVMIDGLARQLRGRFPGVSPRAALWLAVLISAVLFGGSAFFIAENAAAFVQQLIADAPKLDVVIARLAAMVGMDTPPTVSELIRQLDPTKYLGSAARGVQNFASTAAFVLVYLGFIIASRRGWERKVVGLFPVRDRRQEFVAAFLRIRNGLEQYLWVQTVTGLMLAVGALLAMVAVGLHDSLFWAFVIFIASYIPVVGGVIAVAAPPLFALVQFDTLWQAVVLFVVLQVVSMFLGNVIVPRMQGRSLNIDPVVVLLSLAFWSAIWGLTGAFLSTPLTVMAMVILAQFDGARWIAILLSADADPGQLRPRSDAEPPPAAPSTPRKSRSRGV